MEVKSDFESEVREFAGEFGGLKNLHMHGDRAYTRRDSFYSHIGKSVAELDRLTLAEKQKLTWALHTGAAFHSDCIEERMTRLVDESLGFGAGEVGTTVDVTYNTKLSSLEVAERVRDNFQNRSKVLIGAYNPSGFKIKKDAPERFEYFEEAAKRADFLVALAEKDRAGGHIGEQQHNVYMLNLAYQLGKPVHFHVGQENRPTDLTTENLLDALEWVQDVQLMVDPIDFPRPYFVHAISPSCQPEDDFKRTLDRMVERDVGVVCCPRTAISMLQDRSRNAPIHNSIGRVLDFACAGIPVSLGVDNLGDIYIPASSPDVYDEVEYLANALRFYNPRILAKIGCGAELDDFDRGTIQRAVA